MPERPRHEFKTAGGHVLVVNDYITGAEYWAIKEIFMRASKDANIGALSKEAEHVGYKLTVVSVDGKTENVDQIIMGLPLVEYNEVLEHINGIAEPKKKSQTS